MKLSELYLNRYLYRDNSQDMATKDSVFESIDSSNPVAPSIPSGGAAQDINTGNVQLDGNQLIPGTIPTTTLDVSNWGWGQTCAFSSTDLNTVSWGAGTFTSASGVSYSISAGNTGNMAAKTYIYLSLLDSETVYQTTTTPGDSVGLGKVLIAVANPDTATATFNLQQATQITGDNILANSINASKIVTGQLIVGTNVGQGTAVTSSGVTTIIGNTVTTGYINALNITAQYVVSSISITSPSISGAIITGSVLQTGTSGENVNITSNVITVRNGETVTGTFRGAADGTLAGLYTYYVFCSEIGPQSGGFFITGPAGVYIDGETEVDGGLKLVASATSPSSAGQIKNYASGVIDQFRGVPGDGSWVGSFDMTAV